MCILRVMFYVFIALHVTALAIRPCHPVNGVILCHLHWPSQWVNSDNQYEVFFTKTSLCRCVEYIALFRRYIRGPRKTPAYVPVAPPRNASLAAIRTALARASAYLDALPRTLYAYLGRALDAEQALRFRLEQSRHVSLGRDRVYDGALGCPLLFRANIFFITLDTVHCRVAVACQHEPSAASRPHCLGGL